MKPTTRVIANLKAESRFGQEGMTLWRLEGVSPGKLPTWFRRIIDRDFSGHFNADWFDHPSKAGNALVLEPYDLTDHSMRELLAFADRYALRVTISATSQHYPTRTLVVFLMPREATDA